MHCLRSQDLTESWSSFRLKPWSVQEKMSRGLVLGNCTDGHGKHTFFWIVMKWKYSWMWPTSPGNKTEVQAYTWPEEAVPTLGLAWKVLTLEIPKLPEALSGVFMGHLKDLSQFCLWVSSLWGWNSGEVLRDLLPSHLTSSQLQRHGQTACQGAQRRVVEKPDWGTWQI